jgi:hypothetical protein
MILKQYGIIDPEVYKKACTEMIDKEVCDLLLELDLRDEVL